MEAFEHVVKAYMESQGYIVSTNVKFPVTLRTKKSAYEEYQTHGYEVDVVAAKEGALILGSVKSFLGSLGVNRRGFRGLGGNSTEREYNSYRIFNDTKVRDGIVKQACEVYGYRREAIQIKLFVGKFKSEDEHREIAKHLSSMKDRGVKFGVVGLEQIIDGLIREAEKSIYINDPVIMTIKALLASGKLCHAND